MTVITPNTWLQKRYCKRPVFGSILVLMSNTILSPQPLSKPSAAPRSGIHAALWIPTDKNGALKRSSLATHIAWLKQQQLHGILALGSTGEFARMHLRQREEVLENVIALASPLPVIANISSIRLDEVISLGQAAARQGAVGVALMPPTFFPLDQEDILEFFLRAAEKIDLPVYLYNYPEVTGNRIGPDVVARFADAANMAGIKQSGNELSYHEELIAIGRNKDFSVFTAADPLLPKYLKMGASGCFGGLGNFVPELMLGVYNACQNNTLDTIPEKVAQLEQVGKILSPLPLPLNVRSGMEARGFDPGDFKSVVSTKTLATYKKTVDAFRQAFTEWGLPLMENTAKLVPAGQ